MRTQQLGVTVQRLGLNTTKARLAMGALGATLSARAGQATVEKVGAAAEVAENAGISGADLILGTPLVVVGILIVGLLCAGLASGD